MNKVIKALSHYATEYPDSLAFLSEYHQVTYSQLHMLVNRCSSYLLQHGVLSSSRCALVFVEPLLNVVVSLSIMKIGASQLSLSEPELNPQTLGKMKHWNIDTLVSEKSFPMNLSRQIQLNWNQLTSTPTSDHFPSYDIRQPCLLVVGSGTTGIPKNWEISFEQMDARIHTLLLSASIQRGERHFSCVDYYFPSGSYRFWACLIQGACNVFHIGQKKSYDDTIRDFKVDHVYGSSLHAQNMLKRYHLNKHTGLRFPDLKSFTLTGSMVSISLQQAIFEKLTKTLTTAYGTNECGGISMAKPDMLKQYPGTVGQPYPDVQLEIVNEHDQLLATNEIGYLRVKTPGMVFYYGIGSGQHEPIPALKDGWFYPNDLAYQNENGLLFLKGRSDDLIIYDGINIYPKEIEDVLESHPHVQEAVAYPIEKNTGVYLPAASVILDKQYEVDALEDIAQYTQQLLGVKTPSFISIVKEFPRNERGKVLTRILRENTEKEFAGK